MSVRYGLLFKPVKVQFLCHGDRITRALLKPHSKIVLILANSKQKPPIKILENTVGIDFQFDEDIVAASANPRTQSSNMTISIERLCSRIPRSLNHDSKFLPFLA